MLTGCFNETQILSGLFYIQNRINKDPIEACCRIYGVNNRPHWIRIKIAEIVNTHTPLKPIPCQVFFFAFWWVGPTRNNLFHNILMALSMDLRLPSLYFYQRNSKILVAWRCQKIWFSWGVWAFLFIYVRISWVALSDGRHDIHAPFDMSVSYVYIYLKYFLCGTH